ncbi:hypothetical protein JW916_08465 [Candidatus Sumerlaeota bacterium]|nr:hypothetical protein [Candidatus Sumerlaeota bacterium]
MSDDTLDDQEPSRAAQVGERADEDANEAEKRAMKRPGTVSYSLVQPIEVARVCPESCAFCPYPLGGRDTLMPFRTVVREIARGRQLGATMFDVVAGDRVERMPEVQRELQRERARSFGDYLVRCGEIVASSQGGEPRPARLDVGPLDSSEWGRMSRLYAGARLLLTTVDKEVLNSGALCGSSTQNPEKRLESIIAAAEAPIPLTTGTMIGIGESRASREKALRVLGEVARRYGHIRSVLLQAFRPHAATRMADYPATPLSDMLDAVAIARRHLPGVVPVQINALDWREHLPALLEAGAEDLGDLNLRVLSAREADARIEIDLLLKPLEEKGYKIERRSVLGFTDPIHLAGPEDENARIERVETH